MACPAVSNAALADEFGVNKSRYFVNPLTGTGYIALNTARPTFRNVKARQAANYAVDRPALLRTRGKFGGKRTDQILAAAAARLQAGKHVSAQGRRSPRRRRQLWSQGGEVNFLHTTTAASVALAQIAKFNLEQAGFKVNLKPQPFGVAINTMGTKGNEMDAFSIGWIADYFDPYDFINVLLDGTQHPGQEQQQLLVLEQRQVQPADEGRVEADRQGPLHGVREPRRRHHEERGPVDPGVQLHLPRLRQPAGGELHLPPGVRRT